MALPGFQRRYLRSQAHPLKPVVIVGKGGLTEAVLEKLVAELAAHELIKVRFADYKSERKTLATEMAKHARAELAGTVGNVAILYRESEDPERRRISLPKRAD